MKAWMSVCVCVSVCAPTVVVNNVQMYTCHAYVSVCAQVMWARILAHMRRQTHTHTHIHTHTLTRAHRQKCACISAHRIAGRGVAQRTEYSNIPKIKTTSNKNTFQVLI